MGVVSLPDVKSIARADWPYVQVIDVTDRDLSRLSVLAETPGAGRCWPGSPGTRRRGHCSWWTTAGSPASSRVPT